MLSSSTTPKLVTDIQNGAQLSKPFTILFNQDTVEFVFDSSSLTDANKFNNWIFNTLHMGSLTNKGAKKAVQSGNNGYHIFFTRDQFEQLKSVDFSPKEKNINELPDKINPEAIIDPEQIKLHGISVYKDYLTAIENDLSIPKKVREDAIKVTNCMMFIKLNMNFLKYACTHKSDERIYTHKEATQDQSSDKDKGVVRDFSDTSIHIHYETTEKCEEDLTELVKGFESAIEICTRRKKLKEFSSQFRFDASKGCLDARVGAAVEYAMLLETSSIPYLHHLIEEAIQDLSSEEKLDDALVFQEVYQYFVDNHLIEKPCYLQKTSAQNKIVGEEIVITQAIIDDYLENTLGYENPKLPLPKSGKTAAQVLKLIQEGNALVKTIGSTLGVTKHWDFILNQLADPENERPVKQLDQSIDRTQIYDAQTDKVSTRTVNAIRGAAKNTPFTKKTSTTLMIIDGKMPLHNSKDLGLIFDLHKCKIKPKYIFGINAGTDARWWIDQSKAGMRMRATTLEAIRAEHANNRRNDTPVVKNEVYCALQEAATCALLLPSSNTDDILNALIRKQHVQRLLKIEELPIIFINENAFPSELTLPLQAHGLLLAMRSSSPFVKDLDLNTFFTDEMITELSTSRAEEFIAYLGEDPATQTLALKILTQRKDTQGTLCNWAKGESCIHSAIKANHTDLITTLMSRQTLTKVLETRSRDTRNLIEFAGQNNCTAFMDALLSANFPARIQEKFYEDILYNLGRMINALEDKNESIDQRNHLLNLVKIFLEKTKYSYLGIFEKNKSPTLLHGIVHANDLSVLKLLCNSQEKSLRFDFLNNHNGSTALDLAIRLENTEAVTILLKPTFKDSPATAFRVLLVAAQKDNWTLFQDVLNEVDSITLRCATIPSGYTALHFTLLAGQSDLAAKFISKIKYDFSNNRDGQSEIDIAIELEQISALIAMVENTCCQTVDSFSEKLLTIAATNKNQELLAAVLKRYPNIDVLSPLEITADQNIAAILVKHHNQNAPGTKVNVTKAITSLMKKEWFSLAEELLTDNACLEDQSLLHMAVKYNAIGLTQKLAKYFNPTFPDDNGLTTLELAIQEGHYHLINDIIDNAPGAYEFDSICAGKIALMLARNGQIDILKKFINFNTGKITTLVEKETGATLLFYLLYKDNDLFRIACSKIDEKSFVIKNADNQTILDMALDKKDFTKAAIIYKHAFSYLSIEQQISAFTTISKGYEQEQCLLAIQFLPFIPGRDVEERRSKAVVFVNRHIENADTVEKVQAIINYLKAQQENLTFLSKRIKNFGLSFHRHRYEKQSVSGSWLSLMKSAEARMEKLKNAADFTNPLEPTAFIAPLNPTVGNKAQSK